MCTLLGGFAKALEMGIVNNTSEKENYLPA